MPRSRTIATETPRPAPGTPLEAVVEATVGLFHRMKAAAEVVHRADRITAGQRGVLRGLARLGPQTVPQMARARPVSRQHIQMLVRRLEVEGLVELVANPAHERSHLVRLTEPGRATLERMARREAEWFAALRLPVTDDALRDTAAVLAALRRAFETAAAPRHRSAHTVRGSRRPRVLPIRVAVSRTTRRRPAIPVSGPKRRKP